MKGEIKNSLKRLEGTYLGQFKALRQLDEFNDYIGKKRQTFMGYPCNASFRLAEFFKWWGQSSLSQSPLNDVGDPYTDTLYVLNARSFERQVLNFFAELFFIKSVWGYTTSGGTQGNEQGLYMGRQVLAKYGTPVLYFSEEAHYSIASLAKVLGLDYRVIDSQPNGEMNYEDLEQKLETNRPALFSLSIGTTFKGAIDRIEQVDEIVKNKGVENVYYHADAALFGGYLPFYTEAEAEGLELNFQKYPYDSITVSGHKFFGSPVPMGVFLTRYEHILALEAEYIEYIDTHNLTIPCSRSALNTLVFWWRITTTPIEEFIRETRTIIKNAEYLYEQLEKRNYPVWLNPYSNTVYFKAPPLAFCKNWCLSLMTCPQLGPLAHAIMMQHVDKKMIDQFLKAFDQEFLVSPSKEKIKCC